MALETSASLVKLTQPERYRRTTFYYSILCSILFIINIIINTQIIETRADNNLLGSPDSFKITWKGPYNNDVESDIASLLNSKYSDNIINISTKYNESYLCIVPSDNRKESNFDTSARNSSSASSSSSKINKPKTPIQLLEPLFQSNHCSYKYELFWIYELCHGKFLRQYHEENAKYNSKVTQEYYLGRMGYEQAMEEHEKEYERQVKELEESGKPWPTILVHGHHTPYIRFNMTAGTKCDLTKQNRVTQLIYVCHEEPGLDLYSIKEVSTCEYEAIVLCPHLCQHKDFKTDTTTQHEIPCYSLHGAPRYPKKM